MAFDPATCWHDDHPDTCAECEGRERQPAEDDDPRGDDGPYSFIADAYMRRPATADQPPGDSATTDSEHAR